MKISQLFGSSIGKKYLMALTGLFWGGFAVAHFIGNTTLLLEDPDPFNKYAHFLTSLGLLLYLAEAIMAATLLGHIGYAFSVTYSNWKARPENYKKKKRAGRMSKRGFATWSMIFTGILLAIFIYQHIMHFKYGPVYMTEMDGQQVRDLYKTVHEYYANPMSVLYYEFMMILIGVHLSHGFWSAFQSLGISGNRFTPLMYKIGFVLALIVSAGFIFIPLWIHYFMGGV